MNWNAQARAVTVCFGLVGVFSVYSVRLIDLQIIEHEKFTALAAEKHSHKQIIYARRGIIRDAHDEALAENVPVKTVVADASHIRDPVALAAAIANQLEMDPRDLADKLNRTGKGSKHIVLKSEVPEQKAEKIKESLRAANLRGIYFDQDFVRIYPNGQMLSQVIGFVDHEHKGTMGIERTMQDFLQGVDGFRYIETDRTGKELVPYRGQENAAKDGSNVKLTVDLGLQNILETELDAACAQFKPKDATAIMMRPQTGEILAMASRPTFDPNKPGDAVPEQEKNRSVVDMVEPGSTFKIVTTSAVLEEKLVTPDTTVYCENGHFQYAGRLLRDAHPMGVLTVHQVLMKSSNIGVAKLALQLGEARLYEYIRRYGFGQKTGIALSGEISGLVNPPHRWSKLDITRIPMGQSVAVTPLQMVTAMSSIANGGKLMKPMIVSEITDETGRKVATFTPEMVRQVISAGTARKITSALKDVVSKQGTALKAAVPGFRVAGKTGTAQKVDPRGGYLSGRYVTSFVGFMPADDPRFTLLVLLDDPSAKQGEAFGGTVAGPIFSRMAERMARYLDLQPTEEIPPQRVALGQKRVALSRSSRD
ncbi:MAG TPA: penicillin-binding protein 2 [Chthoniobacterales bacterium]|jgi:cell division protein FtsI/penicillin-binding protein 2|nr:penicillin-binding protein 2 [Chthoniobacterales bacterium]